MNAVRTILLSLMLATSASADSITRALPAFFNSGQAFTVTLSVLPSTNVKVQAIEEMPPAGWTTAFVSHGGGFDPSTGKLKWGPFTDATVRTITYQVTPPVGVIGSYSFAGQAAFDSNLLEISGAQGSTRFPGSLHRAIPVNYLPGAAIPITLSVVPAQDVRVWVAEEAIPAGWTVSTIGENGVFDSANRKIKWGPFFEASARSLAYQLTSPLNARGSIELQTALRLDDALLTDATTLPIQPSLLARSFPTNYFPSTPFVVELVATAAPYVQTLALEENIPPGWTPTEITNGGVWDLANRKIKWGPYFLAQNPDPHFHYKLVPAANATAPLALSATAIFDATPVVSQNSLSRFLQHSESEVVRVLPAVYHPGQPLNVSLAATPIDIAFVYALEEVIPPGWTVGSISHQGTFDPTTRRIKWGPYFDSVATPRTFSYQLTPPPNQYGIVSFLGTAFFDDRQVIPSGDTQIINAPPVITRALPARFNPSKTMTVTLNAAPIPGAVAYALEEQIPDGWTVSGISDGGAYDSRNKKLKWGPFLDHNLRSLTYTITPPPDASGPKTFAGSGLFNSEAVGISGSAIIQQNHAPLAVADSISRPLTAFFKVSVFTLLHNDSDEDGDFLNIASVSETTEAGGAVELDWPWIYYTPPPGPPGIDHFTYTLTDSYNGSSTGSVTLMPLPPTNAPAQNVIDLTQLHSGAARVRFSGVPGFNYHIQTSSDFTHWDSAADRIASSVGQFEYIDDAAASFPTRFYRTLWP